MNFEVTQMDGGDVRVVVKFETQDGLDVLRLGAALDKFPMIFLPTHQPGAGMCEIHVYTMKAPRLVEQEIKKALKKVLRP